MKKLIALLFISFSTGLFAQSVTIGTQVWMTKNLDVSRFRNGDLISEAKTYEEWVKAGENKQPVWCYFDNDPANGKKFGRCYNWYAVNDARGLSPAGWHIPSDEDWSILVQYLGGDLVAGKKMKSNIGWNGNGNGTNESGFSGLPGGLGFYDTPFLYLGELGYWWSSSLDRDFGYPRIYVLSSEDSHAGSGFLPPMCGLYVRCLKD